MYHRSGSLTCTGCNKFFRAWFCGCAYSAHRPYVSGDSVQLCTELKILLLLLSTIIIALELCLSVSIWLFTRTWFFVLFIIIIDNNNGSFAWGGNICTYLDWNLRGKYVCMYMLNFIPLDVLERNHAQHLLYSVILGLNTARENVWRNRLTMTGCYLAAPPLEIHFKIQLTSS